MTVLRYLVCLFVILHAGCLFSAEKPNVLFIAVDDLRTELGCYGKERIRSPNIDKLASTGIVFEKAYCMVAVCGASRASLMTGIRPKHDRFVNFATYASKDASKAVPLNRHFKDNGYTTIGNGKIFHHNDDHANGWSLPPWRPKAPTYALPESVRCVEERKKASGNPDARGPAWESADVDDDFYADGKTLDKSLRDLKSLAETKKPFFLAVGFLKPHLPFVAPEKYWNMYDADDIVLPANFELTPKNCPKGAINNYGELRQYFGIPAKGPVPPETAKKLIHGYYACVSYTDALIGRLLDELNALGLGDNTIVVLWGDHGWHLGEHTLWCKHAVFENTMRVPLLIRLPKGKPGLRVQTPVEFIDIFPTLCGLANIPVPPDAQLQGKSLVPLIEGHDLPGPVYATGRFGHGDTIFDGRYRYSEYRANRGKGQIQGRMLYDHATDSQENTNVVGRPENAEVVERLSTELHRIRELP